jgi:hypothetical protein
MDLLTTFIVFVSILLVILILVITSDCDLTLRFFEKFGKKLSNYINKFMFSSNFFTMFSTRCFSWPSGLDCGGIKWNWRVPSIPNGS